MDWTTELYHGLKFEIDDPAFWWYRAKIIRIVDGDTVEALVDLGFDEPKPIYARLADINTPEIYSVKKGSPEREAGLTAAGELAKKILGKEVRLKSAKGDRKGKYGRWIITIYLGDENINDWLVKEGHAERVQY